MGDFLGYGSTKGLAVAHDWGKDMDRLTQNAALDAKAQAEKEQKAEYYSNLLKQGKAVAPVNTERLQEFYDKQNKKVADFVIQNPNFDTDIGKLSEFHNMTDQYLNNDIIREDQQVQQQFAVLQNAIAKGDVRPDEAHLEMEKYDNYRLGKTRDPYVFIPPQREDVQGILNKLADAIPTDALSYEASDGSIHNKKSASLGVDENGNQNTWNTRAMQMIENDKETNFQLSKQFSGSEHLQQAYGTMANWIGNELKNRKGTYDVRTSKGSSGSGSGNNTGEYPRYVDDIATPFNVNNKDGDIMYVTPSNPSLISLTDGADAKGDMSIPAGGKNFLFFTGQNKDGSPQIENSTIRNNMKILRTYRGFKLGQSDFAEAMVQVSVPIGSEQYSSGNRAMYVSVDDNSIHYKDQFIDDYIRDHPKDKENASSAWQRELNANQDKADMLRTEFKHLGLEPVTYRNSGGDPGTSASGVDATVIYQGMAGVNIDTRSHEAISRYESNFHTPAENAKMAPGLSSYAMLKTNSDNKNYVQRFLNNDPTYQTVKKAMDAEGGGDMVPVKGKPGLYKFISKTQQAYFDANTGKWSQ